MKRLRYWEFIFLTLPVTALPVSPIDASSSAHDLVNHILAEPAGFSQMCSLIGPWKRSSDTFSIPPVPAYGVGGPRETFIRPQNYEKLRQVRGAVIADLVARLKEFDPESFIAKDPASNTRSARNPNLLMMLVDLNAIEALPELLRLEELFHALPGNRRQAEYHRDLLGVTAAILRQERYPPLMTSDLEGRFLIAMKSFIQQRFASIQKPENLTDREWELMMFDPVFVGDFLREAVPVDYSETLRDQIVGWARDFLKSVPLEKRKGARGMISQPVAR